MFGGQDENGKYSSEVWLLRAYNGVITKSGESWGGYGNGQLQSGSNASGTGVTNTYMGTCATQLSPDVPPSTSTSIPSPSATSSGSAPTPHAYNVSITHKILAPLSIALVFPLILIYRHSSPSLKSPAEPHKPSSVLILLLPGFLIFGLGIAGLVTSFTSISHDSSLVRRENSTLYLRTRHGIVGVALAAAFYVVVPIGFLYSLIMRHRSDRRNSLSRDEAEKLSARSPALSTTVLEGLPDHPPSASHSRSHSSTGLLQFWKRSMDHSASVDIDGDEFGVRDPPSPSPRPSRGFEIVNRPKNAQRASSHSMSGLLDHSPPRAATHLPMRLGDISWLNRRRMVNTVVRTRCSWRRRGIHGIARASRATSILPSPRFQEHRNPGLRPRRMAYSTGARPLALVFSPSLLSITRHHMKSLFA